MKLTINGEPRDLDAATVTEALGALGMKDARIATALNGTFVPAGSRDTQQLAPGDALEVVAPMQGG